MPLDIERARKAGFFRYLTKPIKINEFMEAVDGALGWVETKPPRATTPLASP
jgi:CheY-like chemotaxis protein